MSDSEKKNCVAGTRHDDAPFLGWRLGTMGIPCASSSVADMLSVLVLGANLGESLVGERQGSWNSTPAVVNRAGVFYFILQGWWEQVLYIANMRADKHASSLLYCCLDRPTSRTVCTRKYGWRWYYIVSNTFTLRCTNWYWLRWCLRWLSVCVPILSEVGMQSWLRPVLLSASVSSSWTLGLGQSEGVLYPACSKAVHSNFIQNIYSDLFLVQARSEIWVTRNNLTWSKVSSRCLQHISVIKLSKVRQYSSVVITVDQQFKLGQGETDNWHYKL